jgi:hypothetical protein
MAVPVGYSITNSGGMAFVYNNLQAAENNVNSSNTNTVGVLPQIQGFEPQSAQFMTARQPGGIAYRQPGNVNFPGGNAAVAVNGVSSILIGGDFGIAAARMGYTKGGGFLITSNSNGTQAITFDTTNTQVNTNSFWGDTTFATINLMILQNLSGVDGISSGNSSWYVNGSATNGAVLNLNTNGTYVVKPNGGTVVVADINGLNSAAANCKVLCTPVNGGVLAVSIYGS